MLPKMGNVLPFNTRPIDRASYASLIADVLRCEIGNSHQAIKTLMRWTGANERTAKNWLSGATGPSGEHLLQLVRNSDAVCECILRLADRKAIVSNHKLVTLRDSLQITSALLSQIIDEQGSLKH